SVTSPTGTRVPAQLIALGQGLARPPHGMVVDGACIVRKACCGIAMAGSGPGHDGGDGRDGGGGPDGSGGLTVVGRDWVVERGHDGAAKQQRLRSAVRSPPPWRRCAP